MEFNLLLQLRLLHFKCSSSSNENVVVVVSVVSRTPEQLVVFTTDTTIYYYQQQQQLMLLMLLLQLLLLLLLANSRVIWYLRFSTQKPHASSFRVRSTKTVVRFPLYERHVPSQPKPHTHCFPYIYRVSHRHNVRNRVPYYRSLVETEFAVFLPTIDRYIIFLHIYIYICISIPPQHPTPPY